MKKKGLPMGQIALNIFFILLTVCYIYPLIITVSMSFEGSANSGFGLFPKEFSYGAYDRIFATPQKILKAYAVTIFYSVVTVALNLVIMSMYAYPLSKMDFKYRNIITFLLFFTTLFSGGMVPKYLLNTTVLHLNNKIWIYIIPSLVNAWNVIVIRTFFQGLPDGLFEAARIDGASEARICFQIAIPLSTPALASIGFLGFVNCWNNWNTSQMYIRNPDLYSLQYLLKIILDDIEVLQEMINSGEILGGAEVQLANLESMRYAMAVVAAGPMMFIFPFFQKYFAKGLTLGSVKG